jgi:hypothetical protein
MKSSILQLARTDRHARFTHRDVVNVIHASGAPSWPEGHCRFTGKAGNRRRHNKGGDERTQKRTRFQMRCCGRRRFLFHRGPFISEENGENVAMPTRMRLMSCVKARKTTLRPSGGTMRDNVSPISFMVGVVFRPSDFDPIGVGAVGSVEGGSRVTMTAPPQVGSLPRLTGAGFDMSLLISLGFDR